MNSMLPVGDTISQSFIKSIKAKNHEKKRLKEFMYAAISDIVSELPTIQNTAVNHDTNGLTMVINISDSHSGKSVDGVFNQEVLTQRMNYLFQRAISEMETIGIEKFDEVCINLIGDHVEGDGTVYPEQAYYVETDIITQILDKLNMLIYNINMLDIYLNKKCKGNVDIRIYAVKGNHGSSKGSAMQQPEANWDNVLYMALDAVIKEKKSYGDFQKVSMAYNTKSKWFDIEIKGWKVRLIHALPQNLHTPKTKYHITSFALNDKINMVLTGHYHEETMVTVGNMKVIRVGSVPGRDEYSDSLGIPACNPEQNLLIMDRENMIRNYIPINLDGYRKTKLSNYHKNKNTNVIIGRSI